MPEITWDNVKPLVASSNQQGSSMQVTFKCPVTSTQVEASAGIQKGRGIADVAKSSAKRSVMWSLRSAVSRTIRSALGYGILGRVGSDVASNLMSQAASSSDSSYSSDEKEAAVVEAFKHVQSQFMWDAKGSTWVSAAGAAETMTDFSQLLAQQAVVQKYDRGVLARMMIEVANADGSISKDEKEFMASFINPDLGSLDELLQRPPLSAAELAEASQGGVRETMLMLAWFLAFCDEELAVQEKERLSTLGQGLGIAPDRAAQLMQYAQAHAVDQALQAVYAGGNRDNAAYQDLVSFGKKIGLADSAIEQVDIRYRKRNGLV